MYTELFLIRHAQTNYTQQKRYCGKIDAVLNKFGVSQANALKERLVDKKFAGIYVSSLKRAVQTAEIAFPNQKTVLADALRELDFGKWEGLTHEQLLEQSPQLYNQWLHSPYSCLPPGGEDVKDMFKRVINFLEEILEKHKGQPIALVTHGGPIKVISGYLREIEPEYIWGITVNSASITTFVLDGRKVIDYAANLGGE